MYAIVRDRSRCLTLRAGDELWVDRMPEAEAGSEVVFDQVQLLKKEDGSVAVGTPHVDGASVVAEVVDQVLDKKIHVHTFKRRKSSERRMGHRQQYTAIRVKEIRG
ncbi:MAG: 50S ribosomal protein L21 [Planctomycetes bacterium]|nr:50S ribosomal protein L21 [Planctomycetota bacterium]